MGSPTDRIRKEKLLGLGSGVKDARDTMAQAEALMGRLNKLVDRCEALLDGGIEIAMGPGPKVTIRPAPKPTLLKARPLKRRS